MDEASCRLSVSSPWVPRDYRQWRYKLAVMLDDAGVAA